MSPKVELLEHHRQVRADAQDLLGVRRAAVVAVALPADRFTLEQDLSLLAVFKQVAAAQQRRLAGSRRTDQRDDIALARRDIHALEHFERPIGLVQVSDFDDGRFGQAEPRADRGMPGINTQSCGLGKGEGRKKPCVTSGQVGGDAGTGRSK